MSRSAKPIPTADGVDTLYSARYGQTYHSRHGALTEARHVFVEGAGAGALLSTGRPCRVLEVGFGTGLNFLATARTAVHAHLEYVALENDLLPVRTLAALNHGRVLDLVAQQRQLVVWRASLPSAPGSYTVSLGSAVRLTLIMGDATKAVLPDGFDAVYLDAFSPEANPELWTPAFLRALFEALRPGGRLATYSAKGSVRRALAAVGFDVCKRPGPPGKRECVVATRPEPQGPPVA